MTQASQPEAPSAPAPGPTDEVAALPDVPWARTRTIVVGIVLFIAFLMAGVGVAFPSPSVRLDAVPYVRSSVLMEGGVGLLVGLAVAIVVASGLAMMVTTARRPMSIGLAVALGLLGLSHRLGGVAVLLTASTGNPYLRLAVELAVLALPLIAVVAVAEVANDGKSDVSDVLLGVLGTAVIFAGVAYFLLPTGERMQVLGGLFVAGFLASGITRSFIAPWCPGWACMAGLAVAAVATYLYQGFATTAVPGRNDILPWSAAMPLDYLSAGIAGVSLGISVGLRGLLESEEDAPA